MTENQSPYMTTSDDQGRIIGMLWFDSAPLKSIEQKIIDAGAAYYARTKRLPAVCLVNDQVKIDQFKTNGSAPMVGTMVIYSKKYIRPGCFLAGEER